MLSREITGHRGLLVLSVFLGILMASASELTIQLIPPEPRENQTVLLNITGITETILFSEWYQGKEIPAANLIIRYNRGGQTNRGDKYFSRAEISGTGSLLIRDVTKDLEGDYTASIQGSNRLYQKTVSLKLTDPGKNEGDGESSQLGGGAIAGIVIGVISVLVALVAGVLYLVKNKDSA